MTMFCLCALAWRNCDWRQFTVSLRWPADNSCLHWYSLC